MEFLSALWMPILVSAVFVWIASFFTHTVFPHHKKEWVGLPDEAKFSAALEGVPAGQYMFPFGTMEDQKNPEFQAKMKAGPCGTLTIWPGAVNMGRNLVLTLLYYMVVGLFAAYVAWHGLGEGEHPYLLVFRITGAVAFAAHGLGWMSHAIWYGWKGFWADLADGLLYALITGGTFGWLWPH